YVEDYVSKFADMKTIYYSNKNNDSLDVLLAKIMENIFNEFPNESRMEKITKCFGENVSSIDIKVTKVEFKPNKEVTYDLIHDFPHYLELSCEEFGKGIFLIIDDINGLSSSSEFPNWYKQFTDTLEADLNYNIPLYILLVSYPEKFNELVRNEPTFGRIFHYEQITNLSDDEVRNFFIDSFKAVQMKCNPDALDLMVHYSNGLPLMMQQIGDSIFWLNNNINYTITGQLAKEGIIDAANQIASKQIRPVLAHITEDEYHDILIKITHLNNEFKKSELISYLDDEEKELLDPFLNDMIDLKILTDINKDGKIFKFSNGLYYAYFLIRSIE
ncbi:MAG: ATP-binding protein, partial [Methanosphaera sp.]|nr:ATP-binding protein [Methanosphaera sp.]